MIKNKNKKTHRKIVFRLNVLMVTLLVSSFFVHLVVTNHGANQRHEISQYLDEYTELQLTQQRLAVQVAELQSSERLAAESNRLNLVKADNIKYIKARGSVVLKD